MRRVNLPEDIESPSDAFLKHDLVAKFAVIASTKNTFTWEEDKSEMFNGFPHTISNQENNKKALFAKINETTEQVVAKGGKGYFWIVAHPKLAKHLENSSYFRNAPDEQMPLGYSYVMWIGTLDRTWRLYTDPLVKVDELLIGAGFSPKTAAYYGLLTAEGFK
jgi:hypothetical protein